MRHLENSGHTETSVLLFTSHGLATIRVRMLPGYRNWTRPDAATIRRFVDATIAESHAPGINRVGRVSPWRVTDDGWWATVDTTEAPSPV